MSQQEIEYRLNLINSRIETIYNIRIVLVGPEDARVSLGFSLNPAIGWPEGAAPIAAPFNLLKTNT